MNAAIVRRLLPAIAAPLLITAALLLTFPSRGVRAGAPPSAPGAPQATSTYTVNVTSPGIQTAGCVSGPGNCTLEGAVQLANAATGSALIRFKPALNGLIINILHTLMITGGSIEIAGNGIELTGVRAPIGEAAVTLDSYLNNIHDLYILGDGPIGTNTQFGVESIGGGTNTLNHMALYWLGGHALHINDTGFNNITNNFIGVRISGGFVYAACDMPNQRDGMLINSPGNIVNNNIVVCNGLVGIALGGSGTDNNKVYGNSVGVLPSGQVLSNTLSGLSVFGGAQNNQIGQAGYARNVISGNGLHGILIQGSQTDSNVVANNYIGLSPDGLAAAPNARNGVTISNTASANIIGGRWPTDTNYISGNGENGVLLFGAGFDTITDTSSNLISGNVIGLSALITGSVPNLGDGVSMANGAHGNAVGTSSVLYGAPHAEANVIAGNSGAGVRIAHGSLNMVMGNVFNRAIVGVYPGPASVYLAQGAMSTTVGYNAMYNDNLAGHDGVVIAGPATMNNTISRNFIYYDFDGIVLTAGTSGNTLLENGVGDSVNSSISLLAGAHDNLILSDELRTGVQDGILLDGIGTTHNLISGTLIASYGGAGIREQNGAAYNRWSRLQSDPFLQSGQQGNGQLGIDKGPTAGAPDGPFPVITGVHTLNLFVTISGYTDPPGANSVIVELYTTLIDMGGFGEGKLYIGTAIVNASGSWSYTYATVPGCYIAFQTITAPGGGTSASSEYGRGSCQALLPIVEH